MLITFEGIDFAGKTTQIELLSKVLKNEKRKVLVIREPGGTIIGEKIRNILLSDEYDIFPLTELFLFEASRHELVKRIIEPKELEGFIILCDRFCDSTIAYQVFGRGLPLEFVKNCNRLASNSITPDITFYIDIPLREFILRRKGAEFDRLESESVDFINKVINGFRTIAKEDKNRIYIIDGTKSIEEIHQEILEITIKKLEGK